MLNAIKKTSITLDLGSMASIVHLTHPLFGKIVLLHRGIWEEVLAKN